MFHRRTLFVLGAGASAEAEMPIGSKLGATIGKKMDIRFEFGTKHIGEGDLQLYGQITNQLRTDVHELQASRFGFAVGTGVGSSELEGLENRQWTATGQSRL